jgi:uncharacterized membrane protein
MKRLIPRRHEFLVLVVMAVVTALLASVMLKEDQALAIGAVPLFIGSCLLGMRRNGQLSRPTEYVK